MKQSIIILLTVINLASFGQTLDDQKVACYGDNQTPYPLYAGSFGMDLKFSESDIALLANNFDALYGGWNLNQEKANAIRKLNPDFDIQSYRGNWRVGGSDLKYVENGHLNEILYYRVGTLSKNLSNAANELIIDDEFGKIIPSTTHPDSLQTYRMEGKNYYNTFFKVDDEYLKIIEVKGDIIKVKRGFANSKSSTHSKGTPVLAPVYGRAPELTGRGYEYRQDEGSMLRWKRFLKDVIYAYNTHGGGIWIDILIGNLSHYTMSGETVPVDRIWDLERNQVYDPLDRAKNAEKGVRYIQDMFYKIYDQYPVIWGNNMLFPVDKKNDRLRMLLSTDVKPRPIDGFAMENSFAQYGYGGHSGKIFMYASFEEWQQNVRSIMYMGELKVSARPLIMDGGIDNKKFASLPKERRHELFLYSYASYLMGVKVEDDGRIYSMLGLCPFVFQEDGNHYVEIDPCLKWNIGRPIETHASKDFLKYKLAGRQVFMRKFENGIVLVNPSKEVEKKISLKKYGNLFDPEQPDRSLNKITINPKNGFILLFK